MGIDISSVGATAVLTAHMRALETGRDDRLFEDHQAAALVAASGLGIESVDLPSVVTGRIYLSVAARTKYLDDQAATAKFTQAVLLGAGLDTRAVRCGWLDRGVKVWEVDRADVVEMKAAALGHKAPAGWATVITDLAEPGWFDELVDAGMDPTAPTLFIAEGLFMYLEDEQSKAIAAAIADRMPGRATLLAVHFGLGARIEADSKQMAARAESGGYGFLSVLGPDPAAWLGERWTVTDARSIAEYSSELGRELPYDENEIGERVTWLFAATARPRCMRNPIQQNRLGSPE